MDNSITKKEYNAIDILKFTLAIFIAVIHSGIDKTVISPILRGAVPLFFIASSYFFFSKLMRLSEKNERNAALFRLMKRNLFLYLIWTAVQFPLLFFMREYYKAGILGGMLSFITDLLLGKSFTGSWYLVTLILGSAIIFLLSKKISAGWLVLITLPLYILCCFQTNYYNLLSPENPILIIGNAWTSLTGLYLFTGIPVALFWIAVGRLLAEKAPKLKTVTLTVAAILSLTLLMTERYITLRLNSAFTDDCYIMLAVICPIIFLLVLKSKLTFKSPIPIRELGVLVYVTHGCIGRIVGYILKLIPMPQGIYEPTKLVITVSAAIALGITVVFIRNKTKLGILKYVC